MIGYPILLLFAVAAIASAYVAQLASALRDRESRPRLKFGLWQTMAAVFLVPTLISIVIALGDSAVREGLGASNAALEGGEIGPLHLASSAVGEVLTIVQSILLVIISIELSHVTLGRLPEKWRNLLLIALVLDVATLVVVYAVKSMDYYAYEFPLLLCLLSMLSSLVIVLMARGITEAILENAP